jgi:hypothetical protein
MADTPADVSGTPDPSGIPANLAAVAPTGDATGIPTAIAAPTAGTDMPTPMGSTPGTEVPPDPEVAAGAVHQNWLSHILDTVGTILGGDKTIVATKHPDGSVSVEHNPSTTGEKWGRIAQAALGGAARGMAVGQGPGGAGRAFAAGTQAGLQQPQQNLDQANQEAANMSQQQLRSAQNAMLNQQVVQGAWNNDHMTTEWNQKQADYMLDFSKRLDDMGAKPEFTNVKDMKQLSAYGITNPLAVDAHLGKDGSMLVTMPDGSGGVSGWSIPPDVAKQKYGKDWDTEQIDLDPTDPLKTTTTPIHVAANTTTNGDHLTREMAISVHNNEVLKNLSAAKSAATTAGAAQTRANTAQTAETAKAPLTQSEITRNNAEANRANAEAQKARAGLPGLPGGTPQPIDDPNYPPAANFDPGTPGINPKKIGVIPADAAKAARLSRNIQHNGQIINEIVTRRPDLVGTINSLGTNWQQKITGTNDKDLAALDGAVDQLAIASAGAHGSRAAGLVEGIHDGVLNHFKNGPDAVKAYVNGQMNSVQTFINEENGYRHYGDPVGPNTAAISRAIGRAPGGAPAATGPATTGTPAANTSQAARQIPQGAQVGRDPKTGQALGYRLNGVWTPF